MQYVMGKNVHRRQLTASQKAVIALRCLPHIKEDSERRRIDRIKDTIAAREETRELLPSSPKSLKSTDIAGS